jgi:hypothetical protein
MGGIWRSCGGGVVCRLLFFSFLLKRICWGEMRWDGWRLERCDMVVRWVTGLVEAAGERWQVLFETVKRPKTRAQA